MTMSRHDPRAQRVIARAKQILAHDPRHAGEQAIAKHVDRLEREVAAIRRQVDAIVRREIAEAKKARQAAVASHSAPYRTRDSGAA